MPRLSGVFYIMVRLLLIRHAATTASKNNLLLGSTDAAVSSSGLQQLEKVSTLLKGYRPEAWYCSPMLRAVQTAEKLQSLGSIDPQFQKDVRLREIDFGRWEQKSFAEIEVSDPELIPAWSRYDDFIFPDGEAVADFTGRVNDVLGEFRSSDKKEIGIVTHGGIIRTMICLSLGVSSRNYLLFTVRPASLTIIDLYPEGGVLSGLNI